MEKLAKEFMGGNSFWFLLFLILKLTNTVDWSWWIITCPLWIPIAFVLTVLVLMGIFMFFVVLYESIKKLPKN